MERNLMTDCDAKQFAVVYEEVRSMLLENVWVKYKEKYEKKNGKKAKGLSFIFKKSSE
jgi:hypothetical protein